jgi:hypothetical protein
MTDEQIKNKNTRIWIPPREERGNYRFYKRFPYKVDVLNDFVLKLHCSFSIKKDIAGWLRLNIPEKQYGYAFGENSVTFGFKSEQHKNKFIAFIENI